MQEWSDNIIIIVIIIIKTITCYSRSLNNFSPPSFLSDYKHKTILSPFVVIN